jgi:hypothetical protein
MICRISQTSRWDSTSALRIESRKIKHYTAISATTEVYNPVEIYQQDLPFLPCKTYVPLPGIFTLGSSPSAIFIPCQMD